jgi:hypothetical protein
MHPVQPKGMNAANQCVLTMFADSDTEPDGVRLTSSMSKASEYIIIAIGMSPIRQL